MFLLEFSHENLSFSNQALVNWFNHLLSIMFYGTRISHPFKELSLFPMSYNTCILFLAQFKLHEMNERCSNICIWTNKQNVMHKIG